MVIYIKCILFLRSFTMIYPDGIGVLLYYSGIYLFCVLGWKFDFRCIYLYFISCFVFLVNLPGSYIYPPGSSISRVYSPPGMKFDFQSIYTTRLEVRFPEYIHYPTGSSISKVYSSPGWKFDFRLDLFHASYSWLPSWKFDFQSIFITRLEV